jgi:oligopeptide transport system substrate-binding protein
MRGRAHLRWVVGVSALALTLAACGGDDGGEEEGNGAAGEPTGSITIDGCTPENPLIPGNTNETCGGDVLDAVFSKLVRYDPDTAEAQNEIAESIESDDNVVWTITLQDGWTFHDGTPVTAQSFVDAWNWVAYAPNAALNAYFMEPIAGYEDLQSEDPDEDGPQEAPAPAAETMSGLEAVDDLTLQVTLSAPASSFPQRLGYTAFAPLPEVFFDDPDAFGEAPVGSGPFVLDEYVPNASFQLSAYEDYNGSEQPKVESITVQIYQDQDAAYADLLGGNLDVLTQLPTSALADQQYEQDLGDRAILAETGIFQSISFAPESVDPSYWTDPRLRQAISMAIDREQIIESIFAGTREPATSWSSPVVDGYEPGTCGTYCTYDAEAAKALFDEAGGYQGTMTLSYNADGDHQAWSEATCNSIATTLEVECVATPVVDFATFRTAINAREQQGIFRTGWQMDYPAIENFLVPLYATGASANDSDYSNPEFDALMTEAASAEGQEALDLYVQGERLLADDMPAIPLWFTTTVNGHSENVTNVKITPFSTLDVLSVETA